MTSDRDDSTNGRSSPEPHPRDAHGRLLPGHHLGGSRRGHHGKGSITAAIRRQANPDAIAARLLELASDRKVSKRDQLKAIELVLNRLEGAPVKRSISVTGNLATALLPPGWEGLDERARGHVLDDLRRRAVEGTLDRSLLGDGLDDVLITGAENADADLQGDADV